MYNFFYTFNIKTFLKIRLHLGHNVNLLNTQMSSYIYGFRHNINIYNLHLFWKPYRYLFATLIKMFFKRNSFFIIGTNTNLPMTTLLENLIETYPFKIKNTTSFYLSGYVDRKWIPGLFSNWKIFYDFIQYLQNPFQKLKKKFRFQKYFFFLKGIRFLKKKPFPDLIIFLNKDDEALYEIKQLQIPLIGFVDTNMFPNDFLYKMLGNNDSVETINFFFDFLKEAVSEGRLQEQQLFYITFIFKLKKLLLVK